MKSLGILGASSLLGDSLVHRSYISNSTPIQLYEHNTSLSKYLDFATIHSNLDAFFLSSDVIVSFIPIWELVSILYSIDSVLIHLKKIVALSSTSAQTKLNSSDRWEAQYAQRFLHSEKRLSDYCLSNRVQLCIVRPTMIWGNCRDLNISFIQKFISRFGFFILPSYGLGLRWPIHYLDLFDLVFLLSQGAACGTFTARGRQALTYFEMVSKIFQWLDIRSNVFVIPPFFLPLVALVARVVTSKPYINIASFQRIDDTEATISDDSTVLISASYFEPQFGSDLYNSTFLAKSVNHLIYTLFK